MVSKRDQARSAKAARDAAAKVSASERGQGMSRTDDAAVWLSAEEAEQRRADRHAEVWARMDEPLAIRMLREARERRGQR